MGEKRPRKKRRAAVVQCVAENIGAVADADAQFGECNSDCFVFGNGVPAVGVPHVPVDDDDAGSGKECVDDDAISEGMFFPTHCAQDKVVI